MTIHLDAFEQKPIQISQAITRISANFDGMKSSLSHENTTKYNDMLEGVSFDSSNDLANQNALNVYNKIAENTLSVINQGQFHFRHLQRTPLSKKEEYANPEWLTKTLNFSIYAEKALVVSTLLLAGLPTIIVTLLPSIFAAALQLITPMMILLPPMGIAACVLGGIILGLKVTEYVLEKQAENNEALSPQEALQQNQQQAIKKLFDINNNKPNSHRSDRLQTNLFFADAVESTEELEDDTWRHSQSI